jgi:hypothetical protein
MQHIEDFDFYADGCPTLLASHSRHNSSMEYMLPPFLTLYDYNTYLHLFSRYM